MTLTEKKIFEAEIIQAARQSLSGLEAIKRTVQSFPDAIRFYRGAEVESIRRVILKFAESAISDLGKINEF